MALSHLSRRRLAALALVLAPWAAAQAALSEFEQRIVDAVKARSPAALELLQKSVQINSGTLNTEGVRAVGALFRAEFDALGFATRWVELPPAMQRGGHLVAERSGARGQRLLLLGHLDTVFEPFSPVPPWQADGQRVRGQGVSDMKGGLVVLLEALRALWQLGALDGSTVRVMLTGDEERVGTPVEVSRAEMVALAQRSDVALSFEGAGREKGQDAVVVGRRGSGSWALTVTGRQGHSAGIFGPVSGYGAAYELARIVNAFREQLPEPGLTFGAGVMLAGTEVEFEVEQARGTAAGKNNVIPAKAMARGDLRYLTVEQRERARSRMREIVAQSLPGTSATISFAEAYPPMAVTPANLALQRAYDQVSQDLGMGPVVAGDPGSRGSGDVQFTAPHVAGLDGLGASGGGAHTPFEFLHADSIEKNAVRAAILIYRLTR